MELKKIYDRQDSTQLNRNLIDSISTSNQIPIVSGLLISVSSLKDLSLKRIFKKISKFTAANDSTGQRFNLILDICFNHKPPNIENRLATSFTCFRNYILQLSKTDISVTIIVRGAVFQLLNLMLQELNECDGITVTTKEDIIIL